LDYKLGVLKTRYNIKEIEGLTKVSSLMLETIAKLKNAVMRSEYIRKLAQELNIKEEALLEEVKKIKPVKAVSGYQEAAARKHHNVNPTEKLLMSLMLEENSLIERIKENLDPADFQDERIARIVSIMFDLVKQGKKVEPQILMNHLGDDISELVCESVFLPQAASESHKEKVLEDCIQRMKNESTKAKRHRLHEMIKLAQNSGDNEQLVRLTEEFHSLIKKEKGKT
jgi:DNA primase